MRPPKSSVPFAKKSFGQNFLADERFVEKIIGALAPRAGETIVEIGAGRGALTEKLVASGARVVAIELDRDLIPLLRQQFGGAENFSLVAEDALKIDFAALAASGSPAGAVKLVANLPYYISTAILQKLIEQRGVFSEMILMFQREVVERITAAPGSRERGFLTILAEAFLETEKLFDVPPDAFRPAPKVWSSIVRVRPKAEAESEVFAGKFEVFRKLASAAFMQKRKTILNNLKNVAPDLAAEIGDAAALLERAEIDPRRRAETLELDEWRRLLRAI
jgi:16S rRNA (adenine1518-N6/adenine1519-N6)-dimethyltransferase